MIFSQPKGCCSRDRKSTRLNSSHGYISYAVFCLKKKEDGRDALHLCLGGGQLAAPQGLRSPGLRARNHGVHAPRGELRCRQRVPRGSGCIAPSRTSRASRAADYIPVLVPPTYPGVERRKLGIRPLPSRAPLEGPPFRRPPLEAHDPLTRASTSFFKVSRAPRHPLLSPTQRSPV